MNQVNVDKAAAQQDQQAINMFRHLLDSSVTPIIIYNRTEARFFYANEQACQILNIDKDSLESISAADVAANLNFEPALGLRDLTQIIASNLVYPINIRNANAKLRRYRVTIEHMTVNGTSYIILTAHDITEFVAQHEDAVSRHQREKAQSDMLTNLAKDPIYSKGELSEIFDDSLEALSSVLHPVSIDAWVRLRENNTEFTPFYKSTNKPLQTRLPEMQLLINELMAHVPVHIENVGIDPRTRSLVPRLWPGRETASAVFYPIHVAGILGAIIAVWRPKDTPWYPDELAFISNVGEYIGQGLRNFLGRRTAADAASMSQMVVNMLTTSDIDAALHEIGMTAERVIGNSNIAIFLLDDRNAAQPVRIVTLDLPSTVTANLQERVIDVITNPDLQAYFQRGRPLMIYREPHPPASDHSNPILQPDYEQAMIMPMVYNKTIRGGIVALYKNPRRFMVGEISLLETLAQQSVSSLEIVKLQAQLAEERSHLELLFELNQRNTSSLETETIAQNALEAICETTGAHYGFLITTSATDDNVNLLAHVGFDQEEIDICASDQPAFRIAKRMMKQRQTAYHSKIASDFEQTDVADSTLSIRSLISVPIILGENAVASLNLGHNEPEYFTQRHVRLVESVGATLSSALIHAQLIANERATVEAERNTQVLATAAQQALDVLGEQLDVDRVLDRILYHAAEVIEAEVYNIILIEGDHGRIVRSRGYQNIEVDEDTITDLKVPVFEFESFKRMIRTGEPVIIDNTRTDPRWVSTKVSRRARAYIGAAIRIGDETVGFINASSLKTGAFKPIDAQRLALFAGYVALALRNAQTYQQTSDYAANLEMRVKSRTNELQLRAKWAEAMINSTRDGIIVLNAEYDTVQSNAIYKHWIQQTLSDQDALHLQNAIHDLTRRTLPSDMQLELFSGTVFDLRATQIDDEPARAILVTIHDITHLRVLDRMKSQFISDISHELRTPITTIGLYTQLLRTDTAPEHLGYLDALNTELISLTRLVESILQVSRYETDRTLLDPKPVDLNVICTGVIGGFEPLAKAKALEFKLSLTDEPITAVVDYNAINLVLTHLVENAIAYTDTGTVMLSTRLVIERNRPWAVISVTDTGMGIPDDELSHIFERFYRGEMPRKRQISGGGMGLALANTITRQHGGYIDVSSNVNHGSTFRVFLPTSNTTFAVTS